MTSKADNTGARQRSRFSLIVWAGAALLLSLPLIAMQFTRDVVWTGMDFAVFGTMLLVACSTFELAMRLSGNTAYRLAVSITVAAAFVLVWVNLAVGVIGSESNPANLMFGGVLLVGLVGAIIARFQARGMAQAMISMAVTQGLVAAVAYGAGLESGVSATAILTGVYIAIWLLAASLFQTAARAD